MDTAAMFYFRRKTTSKTTNNEDLIYSEVRRRARIEYRTIHPRKPRSVCFI